MGQRMRRAGNGLLWVLTGFETLGFGAAGLGKILGKSWPRLFTGWGYAPWFCYLIGAVEITGAVFLLFPRFTSYAALLLMLVMVGAEYTLLTHPGSLGRFAPLGHMLVFAILARGRWGRRVRGLQMPDGDVHLGSAGTT